MAAMVKKTFILIIILVAVGGIACITHSLADRYLVQTNPPDTITCAQTGTVHKITIRHGLAQPVHTEAKLCDKLTITNTDNQLRLLAFGVHEAHHAYNGVIEKLLLKGQSLVITLNKTGNYRFHDHLDDGVQGSFTVTQ